MIERVYHYQIDTEGRLWHEGSEIIDPKVLKFFLRKMEKTPEGRLQVPCMGETNWVSAEDVPYVIQSIDIQGETCILHFLGDYQEELNPKELWVGKENVLYCKVREGKFIARFSRKAYLDLSHYVEEKNSQYFLKLGQQHYPIQLDSTHSI